MLVKDWMSTEIISVQEDTSMMKASKLIKDNNVRRLPVVNKQGRLVGIVTDRDIKEASPSKATSLDVHELYYLLSEIKVKDIMTPKPFTVGVDDTVEKAAVIMLEKKVEGLPVVDGEEQVVGMITESDIFQVLISITGVYQGGVQMGFKLPNQPGSLKAVLADLRAHDARVASILTAYERAQEGFRHVYIRILDLEKSEMKKLEDTLKDKYELLYWVRDNIHPTTPQ